jgi:hypothetical protein
VPSLDKEGILGILETVRRCTAVDHSAPTLMCTLGVANAIYKQVSSFDTQFLLLLIYRPFSKPILPFSNTQFNFFVIYPEWC